MSLEDQIRKIGEARAAEVTTPAWTPSASPRRWGRWAVAAVAVTALLAGAAFTFAADDNGESDLNTVDDPVTPEEPDQDAEIESPVPETTPVVCGAPTVDELDRATHVSANQTPLDIDQDGVNDEMFVLDTDEGDVVFGRLANGWTGRSLASGRLLDQPDGGTAGRDLDGDGWLEFFMYSPTLYQLVSLPQCDEPVAEPVLIATEGEWCIPTGCDVRITCTGDTVVSEMSLPNEMADHPDNTDHMWSRREYPLGVPSDQTPPPTHFLYEDPPPGVPTAADTGVVACSPDVDVDIGAPIRPECVGNPPPPDDARRLDDAIDIDHNGFDDALYTWTENEREGADGLLVIDLGNGYTAPAVIPYNWGGGPEYTGYSHDFDGDANLEFFLTAPSNTAQNIFGTQLTDCTLRVIDYADFPADDPAFAGFLLAGVGGGSCAPIGCVPRITCRDDLLIWEITEPITAWDFESEVDLAEFEVEWRTTTYQFVDGWWDQIDETSTRFFADTPPFSSPMAGTTGHDCSP